MGIQELITYWKVIKKRLWLIALLLGVTVASILVISYLSKPVYKATTLFRVTTPLPAEVPIFREFGLSSNRDELIFTKNDFMILLQDEAITWQVIEDLNLNMNANELQANIVIEPEEFSDFIKLSVTAESPELAVSIANRLVESTAQYFGELNAGSITANKGFIQQQIQDLKEELDQAKQDLIQFQIENKIGSLDGLIRSQQDLIIQLQLRHDMALAQGDKVEADNYKQIIATRYQELQDLILLSAEYDSLLSGPGRIEGTYWDLLNKELEAELKENEILSAKFIRIIPAREPSHPLPRVNMKILLLGVIISLTLGVTLAFVLEYLNNIAEEVVQQENEAIRWDPPAGPGQGQRSEVPNPAR